MNENIQNREEDPIIIQTDSGAVNGQDKCPKCGSTDISLNTKNGLLRCNFCRHEFSPEKAEEEETDISQLKGQTIGSGAQDIVADSKDIVTFKCSSCGAEVVIDTASSTQARCHWCRNTLSMNQQIPNGSVPDMVLPFKVTKDTAKKEIETFVNKRRFFAHPKFQEEFTTSNVMGVYFPYMVVDVNAHASFSGQGERQIRRYKDRNDNIRYDAEVYDVERDFDIAIQGLTIESSADKLNNGAQDKTNNVINAIMPFDIENCVKYNSNYLKGYTSEKRDINIEQLKPLVETQANDVARYSACETLKVYDRGVAWDKEEFQMIGERWKSAYLPVWIYSYLQVHGDKSLLHYVAVNGRTLETMGSVPIHMPKLFAISALVEMLGIIAMFFIDFDYNWTFALSGAIFFLLMLVRYRNFDAVHEHEKETSASLKNLIQKDDYVDKRKGLSNSQIKDRNDQDVKGRQKSIGKIIKGE